MGFSLAAGEKGSHPKTVSCLYGQKCQQHLGWADEGSWCLCGWGWNQTPPLSPGLPVPCEDSPASGQRWDIHRNIVDEICFAVTTRVIGEVSLQSSGLTGPSSCHRSLSVLLRFSPRDWRGERTSPSVLCCLSCGVAALLHARGTCEPVGRTVCE